MAIFSWNNKSIVFKKVLKMNEFIKDMYHLIDMRGQ